MARPDPWGSKHDSWGNQLAEPATAEPSDSDGLIELLNFQDVGRGPLDVLIDVTKLLTHRSMGPVGLDAPRVTDATGWRNLFVASETAGRSHAEPRKLVPAAWDRAQSVTHGEITRVDAYEAAQAKMLVVRRLQQIACDQQL